MYVACGMLRIACSTCGTATDALSTMRYVVRAWCALYVGNSAEQCSATPREDIEHARGTKGYLEYGPGTKGREGTRVLRGTKGYYGHEGTKGRKLARGTQGAKDSTDERKMRIQFRKTAATLNVSALVLPMRLYLPCHAAAVDSL